MLSNLIRKLALVGESDYTKSPTLNSCVKPSDCLPQAVPVASKRWDDNQVLCCFGSAGVDDFRIRDSHAGVLITGTNGSGKTSGSGALLARAYLRAGYGALVLCVKPDEADLWRRYAAETGRSNDLIFFGSDRRWKFDFLDYEASRPGAGSGLTENLIQLFTEMAAVGSGEHVGGKGEDPFWDRAMKSLITDRK